MLDRQSHLSFLGVRSVVGLAGWEFALYRGVEEGCVFQEDEAAPAVKVATECPQETEAVSGEYPGRKVPSLLLFPKYAWTKLRTRQLRALNPRPAPHHEHHRPDIVPLASISIAMRIYFSVVIFSFGLSDTIECCGEPLLRIHRPGNPPIQG